MNESARMAQLLDLCKPQKYTDGERIELVWLWSAEFGSISDRIKALTERATSEQASILAASATNSLSQHPDMLGICFGGVHASLDEYIPREFIVALAADVRRRMDRVSS